MDKKPPALHRSIFRHRLWFIKADEIHTPRMVLFVTHIDIMNASYSNFVTAVVHIFSRNEGYFKMKAEKLLPSYCEARLKSYS